MLTAFQAQFRYSPAALEFISDSSYINYGIVGLVIQA